MEGVTLATQEPGSGSPRLQQMNVAAGPRGSSSLVRSVSMGSSGSEDSGGQPGQGGDHSSSPPTAPTWQQPYVGVVPPLPTNLAHAKAENTLGRGGEFSSSHDNTQTLGKRFREDEEGPLCENHSGITVRPQEPCAPALGGLHTAMMQILAKIAVNLFGRLRNDVLLLLASREMDIHQLLQVKDLEGCHNRDCQQLVLGPGSEHGVDKPLIHIALQNGYFCGVLSVAVWFVLLL